MEILKTIEDLVEDWALILRRAFLNAVALIRDRIALSRVQRFLENGDIDAALNEVNIDPLAFRQLEVSIAQAYEAGGNNAQRRIPPARQPGGGKIDFLFNVRNPTAERWLDTQSSNLITAITEDQKVMVRQHLVAGMEAGDNPRKVAIDLVGRVNPTTGQREGGMIGLTAAQGDWVRKYAEELVTLDSGALTRELRDKRFDRTIAKAIREGKPIPAAKIEAMVAAYRNKALNYRATMISRTEALTALHAAQVEAFEQAVAIGQVDESKVTKVWHSALDDRVRFSHRVMNGQRVKFRESFVSPRGAWLMFPGDPAAPANETIHCRCWMEIKINFLAGVR